MATAGDVASLCDRLWPPEWAEPWDNVGLLVGSGDGAVRRCMCALDADAATVAAAADAGAQMLVSHHPLPFRPLRRVTADDPAGAAVLLAAQRRVAIYSAHTNLDVHPAGTSSALAEALGLRDPAPLQVQAREALFKLVVFVPAGYEDAVLEALAGAGAGHLGHYDRCSFAAPGTGTFRPLAGARPFAGAVGTLERHPEVRLEVLVPEGVRHDAIAAMRRAHPYEEVAYDLLRLDNEGPPRGYGVVGGLTRATRLAAFAAAVGRRLLAGAVRFVGEPERMIRRVAVCGGAGVGAGAVAAALRAGADVVVTADVRYHEARDAEARGLALVDPGHQATEAPVVSTMAAALRAAAAAAGLSFEIVTEPVRTDVWHAAR